LSIQNVFTCWLGASYPPKYDNAYSIV